MDMCYANQKPRTTNLDSNTQTLWRVAFLSKVSRYSLVLVFYPNEAIALPKDSIFQLMLFRSQLMF